MKVYQEPEGGTFESDGVVYDLNGILRDSARLAVNHIAISKLMWCLTGQGLQEPRVVKADYSVPILVALYQGPNLKYRNRPMVVDGEHRCTKALREKRLIIPYRLVPADVMKRHIVRKG